MSISPRKKVARKRPVKKVAKKRGARVVKKRPKVLTLDKICGFTEEDYHTKADHTKFNYEVWVEYKKLVDLHYAGELENCGVSNGITKFILGYHVSDCGMCPTRIFGDSGCIVRANIKKYKKLVDAEYERYSQQQCRRWEC